MEKVTSSIETIEVEAEKLLESARSKANEILLKASEESQQILSSGLPMDKVKAEGQKIIDKARKEADSKVEDSKSKAQEIKAEADKKVEKIVQRMLNIVTGAESR